MAGAQILLVEDDIDQRSALAAVLREAGYDVAVASSAEDALDLLDRQQFDLLIADYQLGGATGAWLARVAIRTLHETSPRMLLMTGHEGIGDTAGLDVLTKPLDIPEFLSRVAAALAHDDAADAVAPSQRIAFILYVSDSVASRRTIRALEALLAPYDRSQIALTIVDLSKAASHQAEQHRIFATPTLLKTFPAPRVWIAGELNRPAVVVRLLEQAGVTAPS
jgi:DNA-binding response OmpR family regulator